MSELPNKVTLEALTALADSGHTEYNHLAGTLTHCTITLPCGFQVTGESACIDPANFNEELGQEIARKKAVNALWPLEGYLLANDRHRAIPLTCDCCRVIEGDDPADKITPDDMLDFGTAIYLLKTGHKVMRAGWNGKGMFLYYVPAASYPMQRNSLETMGGIFPDDMVPYGAYIAMKTAQDNVVPWLASQTDVLAADWQLA